MQRFSETDLIDCTGHEAEVAVLLTACQAFFSLHRLGDGQSPTLEHLMMDLAPGHRQRTRLLGLKGPDGSLVGLVALVKDWLRPRQWCLRVMLVHPEWRNRGIGRRLYDAVVARIKAQGAAAVLIGVLESNAGALRFWQRLGFAVVRQTGHGSGDVQIELEHRFCHVPIAKVAPLGRTLARQLHTLKPKA